MAPAWSGNVIKRTVPILPDAVLGEVDAGEDAGVVFAGGNPGTVAATVDVSLYQIGQNEHHGHLNP